MQQSHGGDIYRNKITYDFSVNINPLGIPAECKKALVEGTDLCENYPDVYGEELITKLAEKKGLDKNQIILGNGAAELIYTFAQTLPIKQAVTICPTFSEYEKAVLSAEGKMEYVRDEQELLTSITEETDAVFLCNPNNPDGRLYDEEFINQVLAQCVKTQTYLFVDECFLPFVDEEDAVTILSHFRGNEDKKYLIVLRAFTKIYAMPGLRLGYAVVGDNALKENMRKHIQPWNTSVLAQHIGSVALDLDEYVSETRKLLTIEHKYLMDELRKLETIGCLQVFDTRANFILLNSEIDLYERLLEQGILVRDCSNFVGLSRGYYRIAVKSHMENVALIDALRRICA